MSLRDIKAQDWLHQGGMEWEEMGWIALSFSTAGVPVHTLQSSSCPLCIAQLPGLSVMPHLQQSEVDWIPETEATG